MYYNSMSNKTCRFENSYHDQLSRKMKGRNREKEEKRNCFDLSWWNLPPRQVEEEKRGGETRNWLDLPRDIMFLIFSKLDAVVILNDAQYVCSSWLQLAKEPQLFRSLILLPDRYVHTTPNTSTKALLKKALWGGRGAFMETISLQSGGFDGWFLHHIAHNAQSLKSLRLAYCALMEDGVVEACSLLPLLEELELSDEKEDITPDVLQRVGHSCAGKLKYFHFTHGAWHGHLEQDKSYYDHLVFAIAQTMPQLRGLRLCLSYLTNNGVQAILQNCPRLENLDLLGCRFNDVEDDLKKVCVERIRDARLPLSKVAPTESEHMILAMQWCWDDIVLKRKQNFGWMEEDEENNTGILVVA